MGGTGVRRGSGSGLSMADSEVCGLGSWMSHSREPVEIGQRRCESFRIRGCLTSAVGFASLAGVPAPTVLRQAQCHGAGEPYRRVHGAGVLQ
jgi:hypothetical protein